MMFIKGADLYGKSIVLTYEGGDKFKTFIGAFASIFIMYCILTYFVFQFRVMILRNDTINSKNSLQKELNSDTEVHNLGLNNINFRKEIDYKGVNLLKDPSYFTYTIKQVSQVYIESGSSFVTNRTKTSIPVASCNMNSFNGLKKEMFDTLSVDEYLCPTVKNYTIAGIYYAPRFNYNEIKVYQCNPSGSSVTCKTNITDVMKQTQLALLVSNNFIDFNNYTQAVQNYLDYMYFWNFAPGLLKKADIFVKKNSINFVDDFV